LYWDCDWGGIKVDSLNIDQRRSRGLGESVKPYKGVKYLCVSNASVHLTKKGN
jgi:AP-3 complex subunit mu